MKNKKKIWIFTLLPQYFTAFFEAGVCARAKEIFDIEVVNIRDFALNKYRSVDDSPYGGGPGMVMRADVCFEALKHKILLPQGIDADQWTALTHAQPHMVFVAPRGIKWDYEQAKIFSNQLTADDSVTDIVFWCGRYEGLDERFLERFIHQTYSVGDFVLSGGELAVQIMLDTSFRYIPGILGNDLSASSDSFENSLLEAPCYTKPKEFLGMTVPEVLTGGHHAKMTAYQHQQSLMLTQKFRPDLLKKVDVV